MTLLSELTTLRLGGPACTVVDCHDSDAVVATVAACDARHEPILVLGGGSNVVASDAGFAGTVARVMTAGISEQPGDGGVTLSVQAGERWERVVDRCVESDLAGIECLAGIPGSTGATPIQNVGAYGQEVAGTVERVLAFDRSTHAIRTLSRDECGFSYRSSAFKAESGRWVVLSVDFRLQASRRSAPIQYGELARALGVAIGDTAPLRDVRDAVIALRTSKGMVLQDGDRDSWSAGSFFLNPVLSPDEAADLQRRVRDRLGLGTAPPLFPTAGGVKTSAAWLIERAGFHRGYGSATGIAISSKHTLALTNRGRGTARELLQLGTEIAIKVQRDFGVVLTPEPVFVGFDWTGPR